MIASLARTVLPPALSFAAGVVILIQDPMPTVDHFGDLGGWLVGVLLVVLGVLLRWGIKDFRDSQRELAKEVSDLKDSVGHLESDLKTHIATCNASQEIAQELAKLVTDSKSKRG